MVCIVYLEDYIGLHLNDLVAGCSLRIMQDKKRL